MTGPGSAVSLGILRDLLRWVCEEMGITLERSAYSVNIRERHDYSMAVFDGRGRCLACGDHMPVHLGSMPASVEAMLRGLALGPGDVGLLNDPYEGGTHLPDITMVQAADVPHAGRLYVACRAHHSDVGGMAPGSMPLATEIYQEGLRVPPVRWVRGGRVDDGVLALLLANVRTPGERRGDLEAQRACLEVGTARLRDVAARFGPGLRRALPRLLDHAARATRALVGTLPRGRFRFSDALDDDGVTVAPVRLSVTLAREGRHGLVVDFRDCAPQVRGSVNCGRAVTISAVAYVVRCLLEADVPMNAGTLRDVRILTRPGTVVDALPPAAVCGGNVETSQRLVDVLLGALAKALPSRIPAASQGTMNNVALGGLGRDGRPFTYYETMGGGTGASPEGPGLGAVHSHMTNSLNTPVEVLEAAFPVRVVRYGIRRGSGGAGRHRGGDGLVREMEMLSHVELTILSDRRRRGPWGLRGGASGRAGRNLLWHAGQLHVLPGKAMRALEAGDRLRIETPGGGGWGRPRRRSR